VAEFLSAVALVAGSLFRSARYRGHLQELLAQTRAQARELQTQQEELRVANEELQQQRDSLQRSQAQLEAQQAELEATNVRLERRPGRWRRAARSSSAAAPGWPRRPRSSSAPTSTSPSSWPT
jgi:peptidoglycan hydrolase CwlO-like protein